MSSNYSYSLNSHKKWRLNKNDTIHNLPLNVKAQMVSFHPEYVKVKPSLPHSRQKERKETTLGLEDPVGQKGEVDREEEQLKKPGICRSLINISNE